MGGYHQSIVMVNVLIAVWHLLSVISYIHVKAVW